MKMKFLHRFNEDKNSDLSLNENIVNIFIESFLDLIEEGEEDEEEIKGGFYLYDGNKYYYPLMSDEYKSVDFFKKTYGRDNIYIGSSICLNMPSEDFFNSTTSKIEDCIEYSKYLTNFFKDVDICIKRFTESLKDLNLDTEVSISNQLSDFYINVDFKIIIKK